MSRWPLSALERLMERRAGRGLRLGLLRPVVLGQRSGLTLVELVIATALLGVIMLGVHQLLFTGLSSQEATGEQQALLDTARFAMERMVQFAQETDDIHSPGGSFDKLEVSERVLDTYNNGTHAYLADGDGQVDADNDTDGLVNEDGSDPMEYITFQLDKTDPTNWKLVERRPDYSTSSTSDTTAWQAVCEHVTSFDVRRLDSDLVQIKLTVAQGNRQVSLNTRAKARFVD